MGELKKSKDRLADFRLKRLVLIPLAIVAFAFTTFAKKHPEWTENVYSQQVYPKLARIVGYLPSLVGFSVAEWLIGLFALVCIAYFIYIASQLIRGKGQRLFHLYRGVTGLIGIFCAVYVVFTILCGPNYHRLTFAEIAGYQLGTPSETEIAEVSQSLAKELNQTKATLANGNEHYEDFTYYAQDSVKSMAQLAKEYPVLGKVDFSQPKPVLLSKLLSYSNIAGIFIPFTMESNVNDDVPFFTMPASMSHELVHQAGFMREDEANFIAYLACQQSNDSLTRYSGLFLAFTQTVSALNKVNPEKAQTIKASLMPKVQQDLRAYNQYWQKYTGYLSDFSSKLNDSYLKANSQKDGVISYNRMVDLLVAERLLAR